LTQTALDRSGAVNDLRAWSIDQYQQGLAISPSATNAGVVVGVGGAVLVDVAIPGFGVEMSMAARAQRAAFEPATNVAQEITRGASTVIGRAEGQLHHIMTNKNWISDATGGPWSPVFERMAAKAGMTLEDAANKVVVAGHKGPHPAQYHQLVYGRLDAATAELSGHAYTAAFRAELSVLRTEIVTSGSRLNKLVTGQ
jgi:hypothetical protein